MIKNIIVFLKVALQRALSYITLPLSVTNFSLLLFNTAILINFRSYGLIIFVGIALFILLFIFGCIDLKYGYLKKEQEIYVNNNPIYIKIINKLDNIESQLKKGKTKK